MENIYRGEPILKGEFIEKLNQLKQDIEKDLLLEPLMPNVVIEAAHRLSKKINQQEVVQQLLLLGVPKWAAEDYVKVTIDSLGREALAKKVNIELGENPFEWKRINEGIEEKNQPLGVIMHIGAGNTLGLSAFSVIEGLLTGNINILKLPENEEGISSKLLMGLIEIEPRLKPYIYVLDVSSRNKEVISKLIDVANGVAVWGSDEAIGAVRLLAPPSLPIIEWGHRLSFAYFSKNDNEEEALVGLAKDICLTDQLYCSSPQCVFYETDNTDELNDFAHRLSKHIANVAEEYPSAVRAFDVQAQITWTHELIKMEELLEKKRLIIDEKKQFSVMIDYNAELKPAPLYRNIWVMPIKREGLLGLLRVHKGHLQTVGLSCRNEDINELSDIFYAAGICRITTCGHMSIHYTGEPHDGIYALGRYIRKVNRRYGR
ncbi:acyl-CoA reductase [Alkaliphilus peptidifermentans]|uniref:Acyl-CoA reductase (LuxC) n=1 Tax=Alkaliphilus peptidifermentans DSM 18978 TaxID=1120976 RepID=A0A1G5FZ08_9FIRM|nr:acyl-CoA reductase [Alkaliphilus peptidifermentans]SCY44444.1 Acyl-CoA reductase (LuxC) [Alkaliphilus peptidifermentans DSM 18978]